MSDQREHGITWTDTTWNPIRGCSRVSEGCRNCYAERVARIVAGTVTKSTVNLPADGVPLIPWRTFRDAAPVESKFLLRMKGVKDALPQIALFEIDAKWQLETVQAIAGYLAKQLPQANIIA